VGRDPAEIRRLTNISPADAEPEALARLTHEYGISAFIMMSDDRDEIVHFGTVVAPAVRKLVAADRAGPRPPASAAGVRPPAPTAPPARRFSDTQLWDESERPSAPASGTGDYTRVGRQISEHLVAVHDYLRTELDTLRDIAAQVLGGAMEAGAARSALNQMTLRQNDWALNAYCARYCTTVTQHHTLEDHSVLPHLKRSEPGLAPVIDRLVEEHVDIHHVISDIDRAMVEFIEEPATGGPRLQQTVDLLTDALLSHLSYEERELLPAIARHGLAPGQL
jgi:hemerythrin-like domain-containing protein